MDNTMQRHSIGLKIIQAEWLKREADRGGTTVAEVMRRLIDQARHLQLDQMGEQVVAVSGSDTPRDDTPVPAKKRINTKQKGNRYEAKSIALLEDAGYSCCRSAASLGCWDIIGVRLDSIMLVQTKFGQWPGSVETAALRASEAPPNARKIIHRWRKGVKLPDIREL